MKGLNAIKGILERSKNQPDVNALVTSSRWNDRGDWDDCGSWADWEDGEEPFDDWIDQE